MNQPPQQDPNHQAGNSFQPTQGAPGRYPVAPGQPPWPEWASQPQWPASGPSKNGGKTKWIIGALAVALAIAITAVIAVVLVRPDSNGNSPADAGGSDSEFASANDTGPVSIITEEPTCDAWNTVAGEYSEAAESIKWDDRNFNIPADSWTPDQRGMYESAGKAMTRAADEAVNLVSRTPHRVMRVLYEQFIAYTRAFVARIPSYVAEDDNILAASNGAGGGISNICGAIAYRSAQAIAPLVKAVSGPTKSLTPDGQPSPTTFLTEPNQVCVNWDALAVKFTDDTEAWRSSDKSIPAKKWAPEQKAINDEVAPIMSASADEMESLGRQSGNPRLEDIAILGAQYRRGFVRALPDYTAADSYLELVATNLVRLINWACKAP